jgi:RecB family exonuclease
VITPRTTRLVRTADLAAFRGALVALACDGPPLDARDRLVIVPTHAAAAHLTRTIEDRLAADDATVIMPDLVTPSELVMSLAARITVDRRTLSDAEREVMLGASARAVKEEGVEPPFHLRPGIISQMLGFYDALRRHRKDIDVFERIALGLLEPGAVDDRGAARLVAQTRFLVSAFRRFEQRTAQEGVDEHGLRQLLLATMPARPATHVVVSVMDDASDPRGLPSVDWDLLSRLPGLTRLDVVVTDTMLAGPLHERIHRLLPGIEEVRFEEAPRRAPKLITTGTSVLQIARDREEEVAAFARRVKPAARSGQLVALDRAALVVHRPLPYVYVAREVLRSAGIPCQTFDALPLGAEPYAAALDLVFAFVESGFARAASTALLRSPHFLFKASPDAAPPMREEVGRPLSAADIASLDRALSEAGYLGDLQALEALLAKWHVADQAHGHLARAVRAGEVLSRLARMLAPLRDASPAAGHLDLLIDFLRTHEGPPRADDPQRARQLRARGAILGTLGTLRDAYARYDMSLVAFEDLAAIVRRWIEEQTFAPRVGESGVHLVDAVSARFGDFDWVQLAGLVDGEWPDSPRRSVFYSTAVLRELGWPPESDRLDAARAAFRDLLRLPSDRIVVSAFSLEADALVSPSALADEIGGDLETVDEPLPALRIFDDEAMGLAPASIGHLRDDVRGHAEWRFETATAADTRPGSTQPVTGRAFSLSALERYQDCPFKFFASDVLRLEEAPEDGSTLTPRARGRFIHELFERFFAEWDARAGGAITSDRLDAAREIFAAVAEPLLVNLPEVDAVLERTRLFGSAIAVGLVDVVLGLEASHPIDVVDRWLEYRLDGEFSLGLPGGPRVALRGVADRIDLMEGRRIRVVDYKSGSAPNPKRALQVPIYALCAQERLTERDGAPWTVDEATYVAFTGKRTVVPVVKAGGVDSDRSLGEARSRAQAVLAGIGAGEFPPRPHDDMICRWCPYSSVCRKDYVDDDE